MNGLVDSDTGFERISQPHHDVTYDVRRGEIASVVPASGPGRPAKPVLLHANLQLTRRCNLACTYCRTASSPKVDTTGELTTEGWIAVFEQLKHAGVRSVFVTGGEIFSRPDIWQLLWELEQRFIAHILSNGTALSDTLTEQQVGIVRRLASVQVSLDSANAEEHDRIRGKGSWMRAVRAIEVVRDLGVEAIVSAVVIPGREAAVQELAELTKHLSVPLLLRPLLPQGRAARCARAVFDLSGLYAQIGTPPYVRGFLAYSEELSAYDVRGCEALLCGVVAVSAAGELKPLLDS